MTSTRDKTYSVGGVRLARPFKVRRLGHFGIDVEDPERCLDFYVNLLGFRPSDELDFASRPANAEALKGIRKTRGYFTHYGGDHHAFVIFPKAARAAMAAARGEGELPNDINQITWQVGSLREIVDGVGYFAEHEVPIVRSGRDMPGSNWHTYVMDPDLHTNELYYGMEQIGWTGHSKPLAMYDRKFLEAPELPQISEEAEVEQAKAAGVDLYSGYRAIESRPATFDVEGVLLPRPFKITRIGPVDLFVDDLDAALVFYRDRLGFVVTEETQVEGHRCVFLRAGGEHHSVALFPKELRSALGLAEHTTLASFGIEVGSYEQLRNAVGFLRDNGIEVRDLPAGMHPGIDLAAYAIDPEGHAMLLYYYMEQVGWQGTSRPHDDTALTIDQWPETLEALSDTYADQTFQGPLG